MALNTLLIDPKRVYSGMFRWYGQDMMNCCVPLSVASTEGTSMATVACLARCNGAECKVVYGSEADLDSFRKDVRLSCSLPSDAPRSVLLVSYSREALGQVGIGHFSPIGGYHEATDQVLILDVARFKYPPHWLPLKAVFEAMQPLDLETGKSRGYLILTATDESRNRVGNCECSTGSCDNSSS